MKYFMIYSHQNTRGIWVHEDFVEDTIQHYFDGHKNVEIVEITEQEYMARIHGECGY